MLCIFLLCNTLLDIYLTALTVNPYNLCYYSCNKPYKAVYLILQVGNQGTDRANYFHKVTVQIGAARNWIQD